MVSDEEIELVITKCMEPARKLFAKGSISQINFERSAYDILREQGVVNLPPYDFSNQEAINKASDFVELLGVAIRLNQTRGLRSHYVSLPEQPLSDSQREDVEKYTTAKSLAKRYFFTLKEMQVPFEFRPTITEFLTTSPDIMRLASRKTMESAAEIICRDLEHLTTVEVSYDALKDLRPN